jgi:hypothetical protein
LTTTPSSPVDQLTGLARLAGMDDLVTPGALSPPPGGFDWPWLAAEAHAQKVQPSLWIGAQHAELLEPLPSAVRRHFERPSGQRPVAAVLEDAADESRRRADDLGDQLMAVLDRAAALGIEALPFKGSQLLVQCVWPDPDARVMVDLDLVAAADDARRLHADLVARGWQPTPGPLKPWSHHLRGLRLPDHVGSVEIHTELVPLGWQAALRADDLRGRRTTTTWRGRPVPVPTASDAITVALLHGWLADEHRFRGTAPVRATLDVERLALAAARRDEVVDWELVRVRLARVGRAEVLARHALLADRWFGRHPPREVEIDAATRRWYPRLAAVTASSGPSARLRRVPYAFDAGRLHRHYGPGNVWGLRARHVADAAGLARRERSR